MDIKSLIFSYENFIFSRKKTRVSLKYSNMSYEESHLLSNSLKITSTVAPKLFKLLEEIEEKLELSNKEIEYFITNDYKMNAKIFSVNDENLLILLTSRLIEVLEEEEFSFVIGHELGHYLLGDFDYNLNENQVDQIIKYNYSKEISADRIGLICSGCVESSIKAMIKIISGLDSKYISNNLSSFMKQHNRLEDSKNNVFGNTHPTLPTRAKALKLFSMSNIYYEWKKIKEKAPINEIQLNRSIKKYLDETSLKHIKIKTLKILKKLKMWLLVLVFTETETLTKYNLELLSNEFGSQKINKMLNYIKTNGESILYNKLLDLRDELNEISIEEKRIFKKSLLEQKELRVYKRNLEKMLKLIDL